MISVAFDVYGTLINTNGVVEKLNNLIGNQAQNFSQTWRYKQLEYSFRRGLGQDYQDFFVCTKDALETCCLIYQKKMSASEKKDLLQIYQKLPAFFDSLEGLKILYKKKKYQLYALSNGSLQAVQKILKNAGLKKYLKGIISCDTLKTFKPNPIVYEYFLQEINTTKEKTWLVSSNPFDIIGASNIGINNIWIKRKKEEVFDCWSGQKKIPQLTISNLLELDSFIK